jgi:hypothetical protein
MVKAIVIAIADQTIFLINLVGLFHHPAHLPCTHKSDYSRIKVWQGLQMQLNPIVIHNEVTKGKAFGDPRLVKRGGYYTKKWLNANL